MHTQRFIQELSLNFNLRNPNTERPTSIFAVVYLNGKQHKFSTGVKVYPSQWNKKKQQAFVSLQLSELDNANNNICNETLDNYRGKFKDFKTSICTDIAKLQSIDTLLIRYMAKGTKKTKTTIPPLVWMKNQIREKVTYLSAFHQFEKYLRENKIEVKEWEDITLKTLQDYNKYLLGKDYSAARYNTLMLSLRIPLKQAYKDPTISFRNIEIKEFLEECNKSTSIKDNGRVALTSEQVDTIYSLPLEDQTEQAVRDMFVFQCLTSLRVSNILGADFTKYKGQRQFEVVQIKEKGSFNQVVSLDLDSRIETILERYNWKFQDIPYSQYNKKIEDIIKKTPFANDTITIKTKLATGKTETKETPLYKAIRSHSGRRTFITELRSNPQIQDRDLLQFTGHANTEMLATYDKTSKQTSVNNILQATGKQQAERSGAIEHPFFALYDFIRDLLNLCRYTEQEIAEKTIEYAKNKNIRLGSTDYYTDKKEWDRTYHNTISQRYGIQEKDIDRVLFRAETGVEWD